MKQTVLLLFCLALCCCKKGNSDDADGAKIEIGLDTPIKSFSPVDAVFDSVSFIPLDTNDDNYFGAQIQTIFTKDRIIISDSGSGRILFFDPDGKYLGEILRRGRGPGEYLSLAQVMADEANGHVIVYNLFSQKMIYYDYAGNLIKEIVDFSNNAIIRDIINLPDGGFLCYTFDMTPERVGTEASGFWRVDSEGVFVENYFNQTETYRWGYSLSIANFQMVDDGVFSLRDPHTSDIYHYDCDTGKVEKYVSYLQSATISEAAKKSGEVNDLDKNYYTSSSIQESEHYIYTTWSNHADNQFDTFYDKDKKSMIYLNFPLDFYNSKLPGRQGMTLNSNRKDVLVMAISGNNILKCLKDPATPQHTKDILQELIAGKTEDQILQMNPILQLLHFKTS